MIAPLFGLELVIAGSNLVEIDTALGQPDNAHHRRVTPYMYPDTVIVSTRYLYLSLPEDKTPITRSLTFNLRSRRGSLTCLQLID